MSVWTDERVSELKRLWGQGLSASKIAGCIGSVSRNSIIGKVHRLGLSGRTSAPNISRRQDKARRSRAKRESAKTAAASRTNQRKIVESLKADPKVQALLDAPPADVALVTNIDDLEQHHCRYMIGEPSDQHYCGHDRVDGLPYCPTHAARCYGREDHRPLPSVRAAIKHEAEALKSVQEFVEA